MFKNYFIVAIRNLMRKKLYTFINVFGLGLGLACCILMTLFAKHEWSYDRFHEKHEQIFRVVTQRMQPNGEAIPFSSFDTTQPLWIVDVLKDELPGAAHVSAFMQDSWAQITKGEEASQQHVGLVSSDFLTMFTFPLLVGDPVTALSRPDGIVINETVARKLFDDVRRDYRNLIGQSVTLQRRPFVVTGVMSDAPVASSLKFDVLIHIDAKRGFRLSGTNNHRYASIYVRTAKGQNTLQNDLNGWSGKDRLSEIRFREKRAFQLILQPLTDVYWNIDMPNLYEPQTNPTTLYILWGFAGLVLLIACSNSITLSISESSGRALEVGLRKVLGANRIQIVRQFWNQALLLSFLGLMLGLVLTELLLPVFNGFVQRDLHIVYFDDGFLLLILLMVVGLLAGSYPAIVMSGFQPVSAIKGEVRIGGRSRLTRTLIVLQYAASITLMICTGVMLQQQAYVQNKDLGFNKDQIVLIHGGNWEIAGRFKQEVLKDPRVAGVTLSDYAFVYSLPGANYKLPNGEVLPNGKDWIITLGVDVDYLSTFEIPLLQGRNFSADRPSDREQAVLINETLAKLLNLENLVGETLEGFSWAGLKNPTIIGVVGDTHLSSLHEPIEPQVLQINHFDNGIFTLVRIRPENMVETIDMLKDVWHTVAPDIKIQFGFGSLGRNYATLSFVDDLLNRKYANERYWSRVLNYSAGLTIILSCLGLFGLASLAVARRTKEVGIRKVLGASASHVMWLLSKDFVKLLLVANVIAWPVAYWAMNKWLTNFAYHVELGVDVFVAAGALTFAVALLTVNVQTVKAARSNPVDALRYE